MRNKILGITAVVILAAVAFVTMQSNSYSVTRTITVNGPPAAAYSLVSDFSRWPEWSPWEELDPGMKKTLTGNAGEAGATYHWSSEKDDVGEGEMTILVVKPPETIYFKLQFIRPFAALNQADFHFAAKGDKTEVTWTMTGPKNFLLKAMMLFMDLETAVGADFDKGLAKLKTKSEAMPPMTTTSGGTPATTTTSGPR